MTSLAWGAHVSAAFRERVAQIAAGLGIDPSWLMAVMFQESSLNPAARNPSGAVGLIQFMPQTAASLGTSTAEIMAMSAERQLEEVAAYYRPWTGRLHNLGDVYGVVLWPAMVGKPDTYVLFDRADPLHPARYRENCGLDLNEDGKVTRAEVCARVAVKLAEGMRPGNVWTGGDPNFGADLTRQELA